MNTVTPIVPDVITTTRTATSFTIMCRSLELFNTASFIVNLLDSDRKNISTQIVTLTTEQYSQWMNNDSYIINLVASILGVTPDPPINVPEPTIVVPEPTIDVPQV